MGRKPYPGVDESLEELCDLQIGKPLDQSDIAEYCGISQQSVCKIEKRAMRKLLSGLRRIGIVRAPGAKDRDRWAIRKNT